MAVTSTNRLAGPFLGNGATTVFPFNFKVFLAADLYVLRVDSAGASSVLVLGTDYTATLNGNQDVSPGGSVVLTTALASGMLMSITSDVEQLQEIILQNLGAFLPSDINGALDRLTILTQQIQVDTDRSLKLGLTDDSSSAELPAAAARANSVLAFDGDGDVTVTPAASFIGPRGPAGPSFTLANGLAQIQNAVGLTTLDVTPFENGQQVYAGSAFAYPIPAAGGPFTLDAASTAPINDATVFGTSTMVGRWVKQFSGKIDIRWFGGNPDGVTDMFPPWAAADVFCAATGNTVYIPTPPAGGQWVLKTPMTVTANVTGDGSAFGYGLATSIYWEPSSPTNFMPAISIVNHVEVKNLDFRGFESIPDHPADLVTSGFVKTAATYTASFAGNTMTVTSFISGTIAIGDSISGARMALCPLGECVITAGSGTSWTISQAQPTVSGVAVTETKLPYLSAVQDGTVMINAATGCYIRNVTTNGTKVGLELSSDGGHVRCYACSFGGGFGVFCSTNQQDFVFEDCDIVGARIACVLAGNGGISAMFRGGHIGFSPFPYLQLIDDVSPRRSPLNPVTGGTAFALLIYGQSLESIGEAALQSQATHVIQFAWISWGTFGYDSNYSLPSSLVPLPNCYMINIPGSLNAFLFLRATTNNAESAIGGGVKAKMRLGSIGQTISFYDIDVCLGSLQLDTPIPCYNTKDIRSPYFDCDYQKRGEKRIQGSGNLLLNPEAVGNWVTESGTVTVVPLSTLTATGQPLAGCVLSRQFIQEMGINPLVAIIPPNGGTNASATLYTHRLTTSPNTRVACFNAWVAQGTAGNAKVTIDGYAYSNPGTNIFGPTFFYVATDTEFISTPLLGMQPVDSGFDAFNRATFSSDVAGSTLYVVGAMLSADDAAMYSPNPGLTELLPGNSSAYALASLPSAAFFAAGSTAFCTDGRNPSEAGGAGTGCPVFVKPVSGTNAWCAAWSGVAVTN